MNYRANFYACQMLLHRIFYNINTFTKRILRMINTFMIHKQLLTYDNLVKQRVCNLKHTNQAKPGYRLRKCFPKRYISSSSNLSEF